VHSNKLRDGFVTKFNADGSGLAWSTYLGGTSYDTPFGLDVDAAGNVYIGGNTSSQDFPIVNAYQPNLRGGDAFVTKINGAGTAILYSTFFGGNDAHGGDTLRDLAVDAEGNMYFTGYTGSTDYPVSANAPQPSLVGLMMAFISKLTAAGGLGYSTYLGGSWLNGGFGIDVDPDGRASVLGFTQSEDFPTANPLFPTLRGVEDAFVTQMSRDGSQFAFSTFLGGSDGREMQSWGGLAVDAGGNIYVTADTQSSDFPTVNAYQPFRGSVADAFVARISEFTPTATPTPQGTLTATPTVCPVGDYSVSVSQGAAPVRGTDYVPVSTCVNCIAPIQLPFPVSFYGQVFRYAYASSSGNLQFASQNGLPYNYCLPNPEYNFTIFGYWDDIHTNVGGIYTSVTGVAPYRAFHIEWRALRMDFDEEVNFTITLFEDGTGRVEITYNEMELQGESATIGVQYGTGGRSTQYACNQDKSVSTGTKLTFTLPNCAVPTPPTATPGPPSQCNVQTFTGSIDVNDPLRDGTLELNNVASSCATPKTCPGVYEGLFGYDRYNFTNTTGATACITVNLDGTECGVSKQYINSSAYMGSFDPNSACTNYLADTGTSSNSFSGPIEYSFTVPAGENFIVLVEETNEAFGCESYTLTVSGLGACPTSTVPPGTSTPIPGSSTPTAGVPAGTATSTGIASRTATRTATPVASGTAVSTPTACTVQFTDVPQDSTFYTYIRCLACRGVIGGYTDGTFRPNNPVTRGQLAKIVSLSAG
ncbi:MAG TPA: SBBP repeat-containing protein, partial [Chloroflexia bacterium]|nr:SBBP repeat-containing protein [Chloroflexia bacterium]